MSLISDIAMDPQPGDWIASRGRKVLVESVEERRVSFRYENPPEHGHAWSRDETWTIEKWRDRIVAQLKWGEQHAVELTCGRKPTE